MLQPAPPLPDFLAASLPFPRRVFTLPEGPDAGRRLHFVDTGAATEGDRGRAAVLLQHGNPTWSFLWRKVVTELPDFRCIAPDLLGLGLSDRLPRLEDHTLERHARSISSLVRGLELDEIIVVGQDWGGPIVTLVGAMLEEDTATRVSGVVLANTAVIPPRRPRGALFHRFARLPLISDLVFRGLGFPQSILHRVQGDRDSIKGEVARAYRWPLGTWKGSSAWANRVAPLALARMVPDAPDHPSMEPLRRGYRWLSASTAPLVLIWGERDPILGGMLARHQRELPRARVVRTKAGHFLQEEVPQQIAEAVRAVSRGSAEPNPEV